MLNAILEKCRKSASTLANNSGKPCRGLLKARAEKRRSWPDRQSATSSVPTGRCRNLAEERKRMTRVYCPQEQEGAKSLHCNPKKAPLTTSSLCRFVSDVP